MNVTTFPSTLQEFFDNAWQWAVVEQHEQCYVRYPDEVTGAARICLYRDDRGNRCLIGASIPDASYKPDMEGVVVSTLLDWLYQLWPDRVVVTADFTFLRQACRNLQQTHDSYRGSASQWPVYIRMALEQFASDYNLRVPPAIGATV